MSRSPHDVSASSLERLVPDALAPEDVTGEATLALHLERYEFAARHLRPGRLLDLACGVGYGTALLAERGGTRLREVVGVDVSEAAIRYARRRYGSSGVRYIAAEGAAFEDGEGFDTIVSLETLEHVEDPILMVARLCALLRPDGVVVASVPCTPSVDANPHHRTDFTERSFRCLFRAHALTEVAALRQVQRFNPLPVLSRQEQRTRDLRPNLAGYYLAHPSAAIRRLIATLRYGFSNRYITIAWSKDRTGQSGVPEPGS